MLDVRIADSNNKKCGEKFGSTKYKMYICKVKCKK